MGSVFRKGSQQTGQATGAANQAAGASGQLANMGLDVASPYFQALRQFGVTGQLPSMLSLTGPLQDIAGQQKTANQSILDTGARGGQLYSQLANNVLQGQLARQSLQSQLQQSLFGQGLQGGLSASTGGMGGLGNAAGILSGLGAQRIGQNQQALSGLGSILGKAMGSQGTSGNFGGSPFNVSGTGLLGLKG